MVGPERGGSTRLAPACCTATPPVSRDTRGTASSAHSGLVTSTTTAPASPATQVTGRGLARPEDRADPPPMFWIGVKRKGPEGTEGEDFRG